MLTGRESEEEKQMLEDLAKLPQETSSQLVYKSLRATQALMQTMLALEARKEVQRIQDEFNTYYVISLTFPCLDKKYQVGCYHTEELAKTVRLIIWGILDNNSDLQKSGGFDLRIDAFRGKIAKCPAGLTLVEPGCAITMVETQLTFKLLKKLADYVPSIVESALKLINEIPIAEEIHQLHFRKEP